MSTLCEGTLKADSCSDQGKVCAELASRFVNIKVYQPQHLQDVMLLALRLMGNLFSSFKVKSMHVILS